MIIDKIIVRPLTEKEIYVAISKQAHIDGLDYINGTEIINVKKGICNCNSCYTEKTMPGFYRGRFIHFPAFGKDVKTVLEKVIATFESFLKDVEYLIRTGEKYSAVEEIKRMKIKARMIKMAIDYFSNVSVVVSDE